MDKLKLGVGDFLAEAVDAHPTAPFLIWAPDGSVLSYQEFQQRADRAAAVWHELGVRAGDRVSFMVDNRPEFLIAWFGLAKVGGVLVAINTGFGAQEATYLVQDSSSKLALVDNRYLEIFDRVAESVPTLRESLPVDPTEGRRSFTELMATEESTAPAVSVGADDIISLIYTSGTTGRPKGVMQTHGNYVLTGQAYPHWMGMDRGDRIYACLPLFHINSQAYSTMGAIGAGGALVLSPRFSAQGFWRDVRTFEVNVFNFIGAMTVILSKKEEAADDADNVVKVAYGVPALPPEVKKVVEVRFGLQVLSGFGMSETTFGLVEPIQGPHKPGSMGVPRNHPDPSVPRTEARIADEHGHDVANGAHGELLIRNAAMMKGYFNDPERTADALDASGWLHTGDTAWRDDDGYFFFVDRKKDIVRRRGENVSSLELERVIDEHPDVLESAVVGVPSELTDEDILVYVVVREGRAVKPPEIVAWCQERLASFKIPRYIEMIDALPKTPTSKIEKHRLRQRPTDPGRFDREAGRAR